jgi:hypothetical protein
MSLRSLLIVRWAVIGFAAGNAILIFVFLTERPMPSMGALMPQGAAIVSGGLVAGGVYGLYRSRFAVEGPADEQAVTELHQSVMTVALLIFAGFAGVFMSGGHVVHSATGTLPKLQAGTSAPGRAVP